VFLALQLDLESELPAARQRLQIPINNEITLAIMLTMLEILSALSRPWPGSFTGMAGVASGWRGQGF